MIRRRPTQSPPYRTDRETLRREVHVETFRARGAGGQHVNRTESAVRLVHPPSGVVVQAQESRSQIRNREVALERLQSTLRRLNARRPSACGASPTSAVWGHGNSSDSGRTQMIRPGPISTCVYNDWLIELVPDMT